MIFALRPARRSAAQPCGPSAPEVPDLLVGAPVAPPVPGRPAAWWALDDAGNDVVVQRVRPAGSAGGMDGATLRRHLDHPHVAPLVRVVRCREGAVAVLGPASGGCLADLLAQRRLPAGEAVTLVAGIGSALQALHDEGLAHGEVCADGVLVDAAGMPLLLGLGAARALPPPTRAQRRSEAVWGSADDDVRALARLGLAALERGPGGACGEGAAAALAEVLTGAAQAAPGQVPTAVQLARDCWAVAPAHPLLTTAPAGTDGPAGTAVTQRVRRVARAAASEGRPAPRPHQPLLRRPGRLAVAALAAGLLLAGSAVLVLRLLDAGSSAAAPPAAPAAAGSDAVIAVATTATTPATDPRLTGDDPAAAVRALAELRVAALTAGDPALLDAVDVPGSPAAAADAALLQSLTGSEPEGLTVAVSSAVVLERTGDVATVEVVAAMSAHRRVTGGQATQVPAGQPVTSRLLLGRHDGAWKVAGTS